MSFRTLPGRRLMAWMCVVALLLVAVAPGTAGLEAVLTLAGGLPGVAGVGRPLRSGDVATPRSLPSAATAARAPPPPIA